jgi:hypothetical protein
MKKIYSWKQGKSTKSKKSNSTNSVKESNISLDPNIKDSIVIDYEYLTANDIIDKIEELVKQYRIIATGADIDNDENSPRDSSDDSHVDSSVGSSVNSSVGSSVNSYVDSHKNNNYIIRNEHLSTNELIDKIKELTYKLKTDNEISSEISCISEAIAIYSGFLNKICENGDKENLGITIYH